MNLRYFVIISPWERAWPFIWIHLNPLHQMYGWNQWFWRRRWNGQTDDRRLVIKKAHLSFQLWWQKKQCVYRKWFCVTCKYQAIYSLHGLFYTRWFYITLVYKELVYSPHYWCNGLKYLTSMFHVISTHYICDIH